MLGEAFQAKSEKVEFLLGPDHQTPSEYFSDILKKKSLEPEKRLMVAILKDAIHSFERAVVKPRFPGESRCCEAEFWIWEDQENRLYSYKNICVEIGLDPVCIRRRLKRWQRARLGGCQKSRGLRRSVRNGVRGDTRSVAYERPKAWGNHGKS